jgi:nucleoside-diphosphate-sugar epimerase
MKYFVTGASGWIGIPTVAGLLGAGHEVVGLARSDASAAKIEAVGATALLGHLDEPDALARAAAGSDGVIHLAFQHDIAFGAGDFTTAARTDRQAVEAMGAALAGTDKPFVLASGVAGLSVGREATEDDGLVPSAQVRGLAASLRQATSLLALSLRGIGVRSSVVRYAPTVHGAGDGGFVARFVQLARANGVSPYVAEGDNRWPAVHISDAARLTRLAAESAPAGSVLHAVGDRGVAFRDIAVAIGRHLDVPTTSLSQEEAWAHFGPQAMFVGLDCPAANDITRRSVDWEPTGPGLIEDLEAGHYFQ